MFCIHDRCSAKSKSLKSTNLGTCLVHRTCSIYKIMLEHTSFKHGFRLARTIGFRTENRIESFLFKQKLICEHLDHSKKRSCMAPSVLLSKMPPNHWFSKRNYVSSMYFLSKTEGLNDHFIAKQRVPRPCTYRSLARGTTLQKPMTLSL